MIDCKCGHDIDRHISSVRGCLVKNCKCKKYSPLCSTCENDGTVLGCKDCGKRSVK